MTQRLVDQKYMPHGAKACVVSGLLCHLSLGTLIKHLHSDLAGRCVTMISINAPHALSICAYDVTKKLGTLVWILTRGNRLQTNARLSESFSFFSFSSLVLLVSDTQDMPLLLD